MALAFAAASTAHGSDSAGVQPFSAKLEPKSMHEECVKLQAGEKRNYYWKADNAVDFNIHYHDGPEVFYPVEARRHARRRWFLRREGRAGLLLDVDCPRQTG